VPFLSHLCFDHHILSFSHSFNLIAQSLPIFPKMRSFTPTTFFISSLAALSASKAYSNDPPVPAVYQKKSLSSSHEARGTVPELVTLYETCSVTAKSVVAPASTKVSGCYNLDKAYGDAVLTWTGVQNYQAVFYSETDCPADKQYIYKETDGSPSCKHESPCFNQNTD